MSELFEEIREMTFQFLQEEGGGVVESSDEVILER